MSIAKELIAYDLSIGRTKIARRPAWCRLSGTLSRGDVGQQAIVYPTQTSANDVICRCVMSLPCKHDPLSCMVSPLSGNVGSRRVTTGQPLLRGRQGRSTPVRSAVG